MASLQSKDICKLHFVHEGPILWCCSCGTIRIQNVGKGYSNLLSHICSAHSNYKNEFLNETGKNTGKFTVLIGRENHPFDFSERVLVRKYSNLQPISDDTLKKCMGLLPVAVEKNISVDLPKKVGLIIDGWTHGTTHYLAIFACYKNSAENYECPLLAIAPLLNECDLGASSMRDFIDATLLVFGRNVECVQFIVADDDNTKKPSRIC